MSLFSVFDPCTGFLFMNWFSVLMLFVVFPFSYWYLCGRVYFIFNSIVKFLESEYSMVFGGSSGRLILIVVIGMFFYILCNNVFGLMPYVFTGTSHFIFTFSLAFPVWVGLMGYFFTNHGELMMAHFVPYGTPSSLMFFMVLIEFVSGVIRPFTLSVRLGANMIAGHLLLVLLGNQFSDLGLVVFFVLIVLVCLLVLELAVAIIQSYVFVTLVVLYYSEV